MIKPMINLLNSFFVLLKSLSRYSISFRSFCCFLTRVSSGAAFFRAASDNNISCLLTSCVISLIKSSFRIKRLWNCYAQARKSVSVWWSTTKLSLVFRWLFSCLKKSNKRSHPEHSCRSCSVLLILSLWWVLFDIKRISLFSVCLFLRFCTTTNNFFVHICRRT